MVDASKPVKIYDRKIPRLAILKGSSLSEILARRKRAHQRLFCSRCGMPICPGDVVLQKECMGHAEFFHSSCSLSRPHISESRFYRSPP
jgi:hypothetical protein